MSLFERWMKSLADLDAAGRRRTLSPPCGLDFSSNDYLGYCGGRFIPPPAANLPVSGTSSRLLRGQHPIWHEVEQALAAWHQCEAALVFSSGYAANEGLLSTVIDPDDWVASDELNHASIIDGLRLSKAERLVFRHQDLDQLEGGLRDVQRRRSAERQVFIVTESLFGMDGDRTPLGEIARIAERFDAHLIVDEAHATGCFGLTGTGLLSPELRPRVLASVHTGGKALGVAGAYICGSRLLKDMLVNRSRHLIYSTALPAVVGTWWQQAISRATNDRDGRERLHQNAETCRCELRRCGVAAGGSDYIVPIIIGDDARSVEVAGIIQRHGFDVRAVRPPSVPPGTARLRVSIHADHDAEPLARLAQVIGECLH